MSLFDRSTLTQIENFSNMMSITTFLPHDVIVKQGDLGKSFYIIIDGVTEVALEHKDFLFFDFREVRNYIGT